LVEIIRMEVIFWKGERVKFKWIEIRIVRVYVKLRPRCTLRREGHRGRIDKGRCSDRVRFVIRCILYAIRYWKVFNVIVVIGARLRGWVKWGIGYWVWNGNRRWIVCRLLVHEVVRGRHGRNHGTVRLVFIIIIHGEDCNIHVGLLILIAERF